MMKNERFENTEQKPDVIAGRNPVSEAVRSNRPIESSQKPVIRKFPLRRLTAQSLIM